MAAATASSGIAASRASSSGRSPSPAGPIAVSHDQPRNATGPSSHRQPMAEDYPGPLNLLVLGLAERRAVASPGDRRLDQGHLELRGAGMAQAAGQAGV